MFGIILQKSVIVQTAVRLWIGGMAMRPIDGKCRYCGGGMYLHTRQGRNIIGESGYIVSLHCQCCHNTAWLFAKDKDMIPETEEKLLRCYGMKEEAK